MLRKPRCKICGRKMTFDSAPTQGWDCKHCGYRKDLNGDEWVGWGGYFPTLIGYKGDNQARDEAINKITNIITHPLFIGGILLLAGIIAWIIHLLKN